MPAQASTLATALKSLGYATGQFGKNHLGDLNKYLPTVHGFDEFFGYLYHLDAMSDPYWYSFPTDKAFYDAQGPRSLIHSWATNTDDPTEMPRWGKVGKQKIVDEGPLAPFPDMSNVPNMHDLPFAKAKYDMTTFDEMLVKASSNFMDQAKKGGKPFFVWHNTTRMHVWTFLSPKYRAMMNSQTNYGLEEAGMAQMDDSIGALLKHLDDIGEANNTIVIFTTDNGAEVFTWPDGGMTPFKATKGTVFEGGFRVPAIIRWPGMVKPGTVENGLFSGLDWYPTLVAAAGNPNITEQLLKGVRLGDRDYKNHLDGYNQMDLLTGKGPSKRREIFYFGGPHLGAVRIDNFKFRFYEQPQGWPGPKVTTDMPTMVNIRQDPFERTPSIGGQSLNDLGGGYMNDFYAREFWRFVDRAAIRHEAGPDGHRLSADAGSGHVQPRRGEEEDRRNDQGTPRAIAEPAPAARPAWACGLVGNEEERDESLTNRLARSAHAVLHDGDGGAGPGAGEAQHPVHHG